MEISFCELLLFGTLGLIAIAFVLAEFGPQLLSVLYKLKESRNGHIGMWVAIPATCCLLGLLAYQAIPAGGIRLVDCHTKEQGAVTTALAAVSLPCPCGCGKHISN